MMRMQAAAAVLPPPPPPHVSAARKIAPAAQKSRKSIGLAAGMDIEGLPDWPSEPAATSKSSQPSAPPPPVVPAKTDHPLWSTSRSHEPVPQRNADYSWPEPPPKKRARTEDSPPTGKSRPAHAERPRSGLRSRPSPPSEPKHQDDRSPKQPPPSDQRIKSSAREVLANGTHIGSEANAPRDQVQRSQGRVSDRDADLASAGSERDRAAVTHGSSLHGRSSPGAPHAEEQRPCSEKPSRGGSADPTKDKPAADGRSRLKAHPSSAKGQRSAEQAPAVPKHQMPARADRDKPTKPHADPIGSARPVESDRQSHRHKSAAAGGSRDASASKHGEGTDGRQAVSAAGADGSAKQRPSSKQDPAAGPSSQPSQPGSRQVDAAGRPQVERPDAATNGSRDRTEAQPAGPHKSSIKRPFNHAGASPEPDASRKHSAKHPFNHADAGEPAYHRSSRRLPADHADAGVATQRKSSPKQPSAKRPREDGYPEGGAASRPSSKQPSRKQSPLPEGSKPAQPSKGSKGEVSRSQEPSSRDRSRSRGRPRSRSQEPQRASAQLDGLPSRASQDADPSSYPRERDSSRDRRSPGRTAQRGSEPLEKQVNGPKEPPPLREATASPAPPGFSRKAGHEPVGEVPASQKRSQLPDKASDQPRKSGAVTGIVQTLRDTDK